MPQTQTSFLTQKLQLSCILFIFSASSHHQSAKSSAQASSLGTHSTDLWLSFHWRGTFNTWTLEQDWCIWSHRGHWRSVGPSIKWSFSWRNLEKGKGFCRCRLEWIKKLLFWSMTGFDQCCKWKLFSCTLFILYLKSLSIILSEGFSTFSKFTSFFFIFCSLFIQ